MSAAQGSGRVLSVEERLARIEKALYEAIREQQNSPGIDFMAGVRVKQYCEALDDVRALRHAHNARRRSIVGWDCPRPDCEGRALYSDAHNARSADESHDYDKRMSELDVAGAEIGWTGAPRSLTDGGEARELVATVREALPGLASERAALDGHTVFAAREALAALKKSITNARKKVAELEQERADSYEGVQ